MIVTTATEIKTPSTQVTREAGAALAVSIVALVVAMGGSAYAGITLGKNSVGTKQLRNGAVDFADQAVRRYAELREQRRNHSVVLSKQRPEKMDWLDLLLAGLRAEFLRSRQRFLSFHG